MRPDEVRVKLKVIWAEVLPDTSYGEHTDFIEAGGNSLKLMSLFIKCMKTFGVKLQVKDFARLNTLERQCDYLCTQLQNRKQNGDV